MQLGTKKKDLFFTVCIIILLLLLTLIVIHWDIKIILRRNKENNKLRLQPVYLYIYVYKKIFYENYLLGVCVDVIDGIDLKSSFVKKRNN